MKARCDNPNRDSYYRYGGRGITYCDEWKKFSPFREWALSRGYQEGLTLERIDNDGNYCPENCRWATRIEQGQNTAINRRYLYRGKWYTVRQLSEMSGAPIGTLKTRLSRGKMSVEDAVATTRNLHERILTSHGISQTISDWARVLHVDYRKIAYLLDRKHMSMDSVVDMLQHTDNIHNQLEVLTD